MAQGLVGARGQVVVVGVAGQLIKQDAAHRMLRVPGMMRLHPLIDAGGGLAALQTVVLHVVHELKQDVAHGRRAQPGQQAGDAKTGQHDNRQQRLHQMELQHLIIQSPKRPAGAAQPVGFEVPGAAVFAAHGAGQKPPERLVQPGRNRVEGRGHVAVVAAVMLNEKVGVPGAQQQGLRQALLPVAGAVPQLVGHVDADGRAAGADTKNGAGRLGGRKVARLQREEKISQQAVQQRHVQIQQAVEKGVALIFSGRRHAGHGRRRGAQVFEQRHQPEGVEQRQPGEAAPQPQAQGGRERQGVGE